MLKKQKLLRLRHLGVHFTQWIKIQVRLKLTDFVASFHLNSSLVPGSHFTCHVELILDSSKFGQRGRWFFPWTHLDGFRFFCVLWIHEDLPSTRWYINWWLINHVTLNYFFLLCQQKYVNLGQLFHFEFMISRLTKSFDIFITASWWVLHSGECEMDYVQFGRDILFITSHRSNK